nr:immunoglobulin heavy chain junction region [Macaca mulatta]MOW19323.1 immunoglobulin heavy chain junction region [Macaca mulatta]MOW19399.1 immunoglobulin heavy chain junction region [Macaca mulatta]MOW19450.1 immunoglobulin heavy chain junction region [Macaca mulatta]MOW19515.1 immunoglobulin heavy chain junction region [Macaca mulatta]
CARQGQKWVQLGGVDSVFDYW